MIKSILALTLVAPTTVQADDFNLDTFLNKTHITIGTAYKLNETGITGLDGVEFRKALTARLEVYYQYTERVKFGISHHSQYSEGAPFNDRGEYEKTELFIDYSFSLSDIF